MKRELSPIEKHVCVLSGLLCMGSLLYILFMAASVDGESLTWRFWNPSGSSAVRCDLVRRYIAVPVLGFFGGLLLACGTRMLDRVKKYYPVFGCAGILLMVPGLVYCGKGLNREVPGSALLYLLWNDLSLAILWWLAAGISLAGFLRGFRAERK